MAGVAIWWSLGGIVWQWSTGGAFSVPACERVGAAAWLGCPMLACLPGCKDAFCVQQQLCWAALPATA